jgi:ATP-dependent DNA helicase RecG
MTEATLLCFDNKVKLYWFNQPYIGKIYPEGTNVNVSGVVSIKNEKPTLMNPHIQKIDKMPELSESLFSKEEIQDEVNDLLIPIYNETKNITSKFLLETIKRIVHSEHFKNIKENIPSDIRDELHLPSIQDAILYTHFPADQKLTLAARKRFLFEEMFILQLKIAKERSLSSHSPAYKINEDKSTKLFDLLKLTPTGAQSKVMQDIVNDLKSGRPMQRLLEGDVGSGKTLIAAGTIYNTIHSKRDSKEFGTPLQAVYLAPTEILAHQQFDSLCRALAHTGIEIGFLTGKTAMKFPSKLNTNEPTKCSRAQLLKWVNEGKISLLVGTHAVTKKSVTFKDLALIVIDEQHRFGIATRLDLAHKKGDKRLEIPHLLSMTATPIPRTLALSIFGDLDLSILDELPKGRKKIETKLCTETNRKDIYKEIEKELQNGRQMFVICTRIDKSDDPENDTGRRNVKETLLHIEKTFPEFKAEGMHSKMKTEEKEKIMTDFANNKIQILVSTSLVEVGVNIPNASIMLIENAERFGLSQLHQLRGRIGRGEHASTCFVFVNTQSEASIARLKNFASTSDGFKLAELDLATRGAGSLLSSNQSGVSDLGMEALKNLKLVETAKRYAQSLIATDVNLNAYPALIESLNKLDKVHLE